MAAALLVAWTWRENRRFQAELVTLRQAMGAVEAERRALEQRVDAERRRGDAERQHAGAADRGLPLARGGPAHEAGRARPRARCRRSATSSGRTRQRIASLETERAAGEQIIKQYGGGVCLIQGAYAFYDAGGRPLRYKEGADDHAAADGHRRPHAGRRRRRSTPSSTTARGSS